MLRTQRRPFHELPRLKVSMLINEAVQRRHDEIKLVGNGLYATEPNIELLGYAGHTRRLHVDHQAVKALDQRGLAGDPRDLSRGHQYSAADHLTAEVAAVFRS